MQLPEGRDTTLLMDALFFIGKRFVGVEFLEHVVNTGECKVLMRGLGAFTVLRSALLEARVQNPLTQMPSGEAAAPSIWTGFNITCFFHRCVHLNA